MQSSNFNSIHLKMYIYNVQLNLPRGKMFDSLNPCLNWSKEFCPHFCSLLFQVFIDRFRYNANRAAQVQSKLKLLEKLWVQVFKKFIFCSVFFITAGSWIGIPNIWETKSLSRHFDDEVKFIQTDFPSASEWDCFLSVALRLHPKLC